MKDEDKRAAQKAIERSFSDGTPIMIDHIALIDPNKYFSKEAIRKRKMRKKENNNA